MRREVVHEQIVRVVYEEVKCVNHLSVVSYKRHFDRLLNYLRYGLFSLLLFLQEFNLHLFLTFFEEELGLSDDLFTFL